MSFPNLVAYSSRFIDGKTVGNTDLVLTSAVSGEKYNVVLVQLTASNVSGAGTPPTVSVGTNSTTFDNIVASFVMPTTTDVNVIKIPVDGAPAVSGNVTIRLRVSVASTMANSYRITARLLIVVDPQDAP